MSDPLLAKQLFPTFSSASSSSSLDQKLADKSSCPGTFFHLFDWNCHLHKGRLFGHKSVPSGQPSSVLKDGTDIEEVLPSRNITLISVNENRGGFPPALETGMEDALHMVQTPEKRKKRTPNVVAKLMGLETMPSPEPFRRQRRPLDVQNPNLLCTPEENTYISNSGVLLVRPRFPEFDRNIRSCSSGLKSSKKDLLHDLSLRQANENETKGRKHHEAQMQPLIIEPGIRSHEKTHVKSGPAAGNSENIQENRDNKKFTERKLPAARSVKLKGPLLHLDTADTTAQSGMKKDKESINVQVSQRVSRPQRENKMAAVKTSMSIPISREEMIRQPIMLGENDKRDKGHGKCHLSQQDPSLKNVEKVKPELKRQEQTCRRLSQTDGEKNQISRSVKGKAIMDACPLNADMARPENHENQRELSASSTISTVNHDSGGCSTSSILKHKRHSSSARDARNKEGNKIKVQKTGTRGNLSPYVKSSVVRRGSDQALREYVPTFEKSLSLKDAEGATQSLLMPHNEGVSDASSIAEECITECCSADHRYSSLSVVCDREDPSRTNNAYMPMLQDNSSDVESAITCDGFCSAETQGTSISSKHCTFQDNAGDSSNVLGITERMCQSSCKSTIEDAGDTASSFETKNQKQLVSYSGKSTATILKELLMALNPSTKQFIGEDTSEEDRTTSRLDDIRITATTGSNNINYIRGQGLNYADSASNDDNICHDLIKVLSDGRHSLKECNDNCWQPSSNSAWVLPSGYGSSINPESFSSVQVLLISERECCGQESCRQVIDIKSFAHDNPISSLSLQKHAGTLAKVVQSEEDYLKHIVSSANLTLSKIYSAKLQLSGSLIESAVFNEAEENFQHQWKWGIQHEHEGEDVGFPYDAAARINRKLVFDCIGEALKLDIGVNEQESLQNNMPNWHPLSPECCSRRTQRQINDWRDMACGINVDDIVEKEMNSGIGKWVEFPSEVYQIAVDVECSILKDFIAELVLDVSTVIQKVPMKMRCKNKGLAKAQKEKHFWVGL